MNLSRRNAFFHNIIKHNAILFATGDGDTNNTMDDKADHQFNTAQSSRQLTNMSAQEASNIQQPAVAASIPGDEVAPADVAEDGSRTEYGAA